MNKKMLVFIINPVSGNGKGLQVWNKVKKELEKRNVRYRSFFTKHAGHAEDLAIQVVELHKEKLSALVVVGGDGTVHEVVNGLSAYPQVSIGYIPGGSGNDFARGFAIPKSPIKALERILRWNGRSIKQFDIGKFHFREKTKHARMFVNGVGIGFDGEVARITKDANYKRWLNKLRFGGLAYFVTAVRLIFSYQPCQVTVTIDGEEKQFDNVWLIAVSNIPYYGGGMKITPQAKTNDQVLNLCIVHNISRWLLASILGTVFIGQHHKFKQVTMLEGKEISVRSDRPMTIHADGEIIGVTPININIHERSQALI
jgi:diacylglycerol kinase (ATP)